jgi:hypothetical protein
MQNIWWEEGYCVFGLHAIRNGYCTCDNPDCTMAGKHPWAYGWQHGQVWSEEQYENMVEAGAFKTGYGLLVKGLLVVDIDERSGGVDSYARLMDDFPEISGCGLIVETGSGKGSRHLYFKMPEGAYVQNLNKYPGIDFKTTGYVVGPGSMHKSGNPYTVLYGSIQDIDDAPASLVAALVRPEVKRVVHNGHAVDVTDDQLVEMLSFIDPDCVYDTWIKVGMSLHHVSSGAGLDVWDKWSRAGKKYPGHSTLSIHWQSFGKSSNPAMYGTLHHIATSAGWSAAVEFVIPEGLFTEDAFDVRQIDLLRPPGFTGEICRWINSQCRRPRETLAVAASLVTIGNIIGLHHVDAVDDVTSNLFAFCVAGARTGKEAIQQAMAKLHKAAGIHPAVHGPIKSEQEILRNLTRNQASFYIIDEVGLYLQKVRNAQTRGSASYLEGVISTLMSTYSKAHGTMLISGDMKVAIRVEVTKEHKQLIRQLDDTPANKQDDIKRKISQLERQIEQIDDGLVNPFLSFVGFTTPVTFDDLVDFQSATNGFIGRSLIFNERETVPRALQEFNPPPLDEHISLRLAMLALGGTMSTSKRDRIDRDETIPACVVHTTEDALDMLERCVTHFEDMALEFKATTGLEALALGAYELVAKVSFILAAPDGVRTLEHVRWAFALVLRDINDKARLVSSNDHAEDDPDKALALKILSIVDSKEGEIEGMIVSRCRKRGKNGVGGDREKVLSILASLVKNGVVTKADESYNDNTGRHVRKFRYRSETAK